MARQNWDFPLEPAPNPWKRERRVTMTISRLVILIFLTFTIGWVAGMLTPDVDTTHHGVKVTESMRTAQNYADWCGGFVTTEVGGPYVVGCDR